jgi:hypothetical protein
MIGVILGDATLIPLAWEQAISRILDCRKHRFYMLVAVRAAIAWLSEQEADTAIPFQEVENRFVEAMQHLEPANIDRAYQPLYWLDGDEDRGAQVWELYRGTGMVRLFQMDREFRPWRAWLLRNDAYARFKPDLVAGLAEVDTRKHIVAEINRLCETESK